jgi:antitoxin (DNA-binding transcriptional repressor) of toxin-antitoxin stability system
MKKRFISVTEAARNFADCVNRAHYQNVTFVLLKNGVPFARLVPDSMPDNVSNDVPDNARACSGRELAEVLAKTELPEETARAWRRDLRAARQSLKHPADKW